MTACHQIILAVAIKGQRPPLPPDLPLGLRLLIAACWREDPRRRPSCAEVDLPTLHTVYTPSVVDPDLDLNDTSVCMHA